MSTITATNDDARSRVRLDLDFSDIDAPYVYVTRVNQVTGQSTPVRVHGPGTSLGGLTYQNLYAGYKTVMYDTEMPLDTPVYYTATAVVSQLNVNGDFEGGYLAPWVASNGAIPFLSVAAVHSGKYSMQVNGDGTTANPTMTAERIPADPGVVFTYSAWVLEDIGGGALTVTLQVQWLNAALGVISTASPASAAVGGSWTQLSGTATAPALTAYAVPIIQITATPAAPKRFWYDQITFSSAAGSATSSGVTVDSLGACWLKDPQAPGGNVRVDFCFDPNPLCTPQEGVFWMSMGSEGYAANSATFNVNNLAPAIGVSKTRSAVDSTLTLVARQFADRDRLLALLSTGRPLLFQAPAQYGVPDLNMGIGKVQVDRIMPDIRFPIRVLTLPYVAERAPGGPSAGVSGARWQDDCNVYATWGAVNSAGITWLQVLQGAIG